MPRPEVQPEAIPGYGEVAPIHSSKAFRVFYAQDPADELVVVKQLLANGSEEGVKPHEDEFILKERLACEALILEELDHPQITRILANNTDHFSPHFVMAPVASLRDLRGFNQTSQPLAASRIIHSVLEPLAYIHSNDIVHRDVKPGNILARWLGQSAVLADFGIAAKRRELEQPSLNGDGPMTVYEAATGLTDTFGPVGTAEYASPEQAQGKKVDITTDIYSLGLSFFQLLYGRLPFDYKNPNDRIKAMSLRFDIDVDLTIPEGRDIPRPLIGIIERATQREPADRYQSAEEMQEDLARAIVATGDSLL